MSDAQRQRTQGNGAAREAESVGTSTGATRPEQSLGLEDVKFETEEDHDTLPPDDKARSGKPGSPHPGSITVQVVGRSDVGLVREHNEDNYLLADLSTGSRDPATFHEVPTAGLLLAVCDGMGGAAAGEVASQMAVDTVYEMMRRSVPAADRDALAHALVRSIEEAGARIFEAARADRSRRGMGTTSTVASLMDKTLFVGQVGDSRAYVLRSGELKQVTKDQSLVNQLIEAGQLTEDEAEAFEHSNIILQALGTTEQVSVDLTFLELRRGDRLLMCSDGLSGLVHGDVIREVMAEYQDLNACCERLIELAKAGGGHDNVTVLLCEFSGEGLAPVQAGDLAGYQQYPLPMDHESRGAGPLNSDVPTLAPPSGRGHDHEGYEAFGDFAADGSRSSGSTLRYIMLAMLILAAAGAVYYWTGAGARNAVRPEAPSVIDAPPSAPQAPSRVEVVVRTDVEGGELYVDGEPYGAASDGRWVLDLAPGPHKLEARAAGSSITSSTVTVREGIPATVLLSIPEGAGALANDAGVKRNDAGGASGPDTARDKARDRQRVAHEGDAVSDGGAKRARRHREREAQATGADPTAVQTATPTPTPTPSP